MEKHKILIIDDDKEFVGAIQTTLESSGFEVAAAFDGKEGLKKTKKQKPDLVILDLMLPEKDGLSVCQDLKSDDLTESIPILMLTSLGKKSEGKEGAEILSKGHKAEAYLEKPIEPEVLVKKARELIERPDWMAEKRPKVLFIDDDPDFFAAMTMALDKYEFDIVISKTGEDGLLKAISENPDIILLDVMLPEKDGYAVCRELKEGEKTKNIPVIMLTAVGEKLTVPDYAGVIARSHQADDYIEKPVEPKEIIDRIRMLIDPTREKDPFYHY
jgi:two-component system alkaline phosphatase synthesis response regulator PhoP